MFLSHLTQAHIDQLHEAVGSIPNVRFGSTGNKKMAVHLCHNTDGSVGV